MLGGCRCDVIILWDLSREIGRLWLLIMVMVVVVFFILFFSSSYSSCQNVRLLHTDTRVFCSLGTRKLVAGHLWDSGFLF